MTLYTDLQHLEQDTLLVARHFVARPEERAVQRHDGQWNPDAIRDQSGNVIGYHPHSQGSIESHLQGFNTYGHYVINKRNECKVAVFDIDLKKTGLLPVVQPGEDVGFYSKMEQCDDVLSVWRDWSHPARRYLKAQIKSCATYIAAQIEKNVGLNTAIEYSGSKGMHVYAFLPKNADGSLHSSRDAFDLSQIIMQVTGRFTPRRGDNFWNDINGDPVTGWPAVEIETFPKQPETDGFGNLVALPLGINRKDPRKPKFFVSPTTPPVDWSPITLSQALELGSFSDAQLAASGWLDGTNA